MFTIARRVHPARAVSACIQQRRRLLVVEIELVQSIEAPIGLIVTVVGDLELESGDIGTVLVPGRIAQVQRVGHPAPSKDGQQVPNAPKDGSLISAVKSGPERITKVLGLPEAASTANPYTGSVITELSAPVTGE